MNIIESVKSLRDKTHLSMALCKKALDEANGDVSKAVEILQKSGEVKRIDENSKSSEGIVKGYKFPDKKLTVILGLSCQTDFAAKSPLFQEAMDKIANKVEGSSAGQDFKDDIEMLSKQLGEVIQIKSLNRLKTMERLNPESEKIEVMDYHVYNHFTNKLSVVLYYTATKDLVGKAELNTFLDMCAMQIAALKPLALCSEHLASSLLEKQEKIFEAQLPEKAKSNPEMAKKIIAGKLIKWKQENVLLEQESIVLPGKTLTQLKKEIETEGNKVSLTLFERIEL